MVENDYQVYVFGTLAKKKSLHQILHQMVPDNFMSAPSCTKSGVFAAKNFLQLKVGYIVWSEKYILLSAENPN